jgi:hypothetical protein
MAIVKDNMTGQEGQQKDDCFLKSALVTDKRWYVMGALKKCRKGVFGITVSAKNQETKGLPR